jgi:hypothetical protein
MAVDRNNDEERLARLDHLIKQANAKGKAISAESKGKSAKARDLRDTKMSTTRATSGPRTSSKSR